MSTRRVVTDRYVEDEIQIIILLTINIAYQAELFIQRNVMTVITNGGIVQSTLYPLGEYTCKYSVPTSYFDKTEVRVAMVMHSSLGPL